MNGLVRISLGIFLLTTGCIEERKLHLSLPDSEPIKRTLGAFYISNVADKRRFEQNPRKLSTPSVKGYLRTYPKEKLPTIVGRYSSLSNDYWNVMLEEGMTTETSVRRLLETGLKRQGYSITDEFGGEHRMAVEIKQFWAWPVAIIKQEGLFHAIIECDLVIQSGNRSINITVKGHGVEEPRIGSESIWEIVYRAAIGDFMNNLNQELRRHQL